MDVAKVAFDDKFLSESYTRFDAARLDSYKGLIDGSHNFAEMSMDRQVLIIGVESQNQRHPLQGAKHDDILE